MTLFIKFGVWVEPKILWDNELKDLLIRFGTFQALVNVLSEVDESFVPKLERILDTKE